jgi:hypothetical protein
MIVVTVIPLSKHFLLVVSHSYSAKSSGYLRHNEADDRH